LINDVTNEVFFGDADNNEIHILEISAKSSSDNDDVISTVGSSVAATTDDELNGATLDDDSFFLVDAVDKADVNDNADDANNL
jgi:hypothetical protein